MQIKRALARPVKSAFRAMGYEVVASWRPQAKTWTMPPDLDESTLRMIEQVQPHTLTSVDRMAALVDAVRHVVRHDIPGALVECGVFKGGSAMLMALALLDLGVDDRDVYLFDTFTHMPEPGEHDMRFDGLHAKDYYDDAAAAPEHQYRPIDGVREAMATTGYPMERVHLVQGLVEDTVPDQAPEQIAVLRLDTDWYESTAHEMAHLWPRIPSNGVLIVDDYGHFLGAKKAVDEYFEANELRVLLHRIDYTGRTVVKP